MKNFILNVLVIILFSSKHVAGQEGIDCLGKAFHCVNSTHFLICVDFGHEVSVTVDNFAIPCPPSTACRHLNKFECELEPTNNVTPMISTTKKNTASAKNLPTSQNTEKQWEAAVTNTDAVILKFDNTASSTVTVEKEALTEINNSSTTLSRGAKPALIFLSESAAITNTSQTPTYSPSNLSYSMYDSAIIGLERTTLESSVPLNQSSNTSDGVNTITKNKTANATTLPTIPKAIETEQFTADSVYNMIESEFKLISLVPPSPGNYASSENLKVTNKQIHHDSSTSQDAPNSYGIEISMMTNPPSLQYIPQKSRTTHGVIETGLYNTLKPSILTTAALKSTDHIFINIIPDSSANQVTTSSSAIEISTTEPSNLQHSTQVVRITPVLNETQNYNTLKPNVSTAETLTSSGIEISTTEPSTLQHSTKQVNSYELSEKILTTSINGTEISIINPSTGHYITQEVNIIPTATEAQNDSILKQNVSSTKTATFVNETPVYVTPELLVNEVQSSYTESKISTMDLPPLQHVTQESRITHGVMKIQVYNNSKPNDSMIAASTLTDLKSVNLKSELSVNQVTTSSSANEISTINISTLQHSTQEVSIPPIVIEIQNFTTLKPNVLTTETLQSMNQKFVHTIPESSANQVTMSSSAIEIPATEPSTLEHSTRKVRITPVVIETQNYSTLKPHVSTAETSSKNQIFVSIIPELSANQVTTSSSAIEISTTDPSTLEHSTQEVRITPVLNETQKYSSLKPNVSTAETLQSKNQSFVNNHLITSSGIEISTMTEASTLQHSTKQVNSYELSEKILTTNINGIEISTINPSTGHYITQELNIIPAATEAQNDSTLKPNVSSTITAISMNETSVYVTPDLFVNEVQTSYTEIKISTMALPPLQHVTQESSITHGVMEKQVYNNSKPNDSMIAASTLTDLKSTNLTLELSVNQVTTSSSENEISTINTSTLQHSTQEVSITPVVIEIQNFTTLKPNVSTTETLQSINHTLFNIIPKSLANQVTTSSGIEISTTELSTLQHRTKQVISHEFSAKANTLTTSTNGIEISTINPSTAHYLTQKVRITPAATEAQNVSTLDPNVSTTTIATAMNEISVNIPPELSANGVQMSHSEIKIPTMDLPALQQVNQESSITQGVIERKDYNNSKANESMTAASILMDLKSVNMTSELLANEVTTSFSEILRSTTDPSTLQHSTQEVIETQNYNTLKPNVSRTETLQSMNQTFVNIIPESSANQVKTSTGIEISTTEPSTLQHSIKQVISHEFSEKANTSTLTTSTIGTEISTINPSTAPYITQKVRITLAATEAQNDSTLKPNVSTAETLQYKNQILVNIIPESSVNQLTSSSAIEISMPNPSTLQQSTQEVRITTVLNETQNYSTLKPNISRTETLQSMNQTFVNIIPESSANQVKTSTGIEISTTEPSTLHHSTKQVISHEFSEKANTLTTSTNGIEISTINPSTEDNLTQKVRITTAATEAENYSTLKPNVSTTTIATALNEISVNITPESSVNGVQMSHSEIKISTMDLPALKQVNQESSITQGVIERKDYNNSKANESMTAASILTDLKSVNMTSELSANEFTTSFSEILISTTDPSTLQHSTQEVRITPILIETQNYNTLKLNVSTTETLQSINQTFVNIIPESSANQVKPSTGIEISTTEPSTLQHSTKQVISHEFSEKANTLTTSTKGIEISTINPSTEDYLTQKVRITTAATEAENDSTLKPNVSTTTTATAMNEISVNITPELSANGVQTSNSEIKISKTDLPPLQHVTQDSRITHGVIEIEDYNNSKPMTATSKLTDLKSVNITPELSANQLTTSFSGTKISTTDPSTLQHSIKEVREYIFETQNSTPSKPNVSTTAAVISKNLTPFNINYNKLSASQEAISSGGTEISTTNPCTAQYITQEVRILPAIIETQNYSTLKPNISTTAASISTNHKSMNIISESLEKKVTTSSSGNKISTTNTTPLQYVNEESRTTNRVIETDYYKNNDSKPNESMTASITTNHIFVNRIPESPANQVSITTRGITIHTTDPFSLPHITQEVSIKPPVVAVTQDYSARKTNLSSTATSTSPNQTSGNIASQVSANQASSGGLEMATEDPYQLQYSSQEPKTTPVVIETQNYNTLIPNFSTTTASISFNPITAYITSKRPVKQAKQMTPNDTTIESKFDVKQTNNFSNLPAPIVLGVSSVNYDSEYIYNNTENKSIIENSQAESSFNLPKSTSVYQSTVYKTKTLNNFPKPQTTITEISKTTIDTLLFPPQGNLHTKNNGISVIDKTEISSVTQINHVTSVLNNSTAITDHMSGNHISSDTSATITTVTGRTSAIPPVKSSYDSSLMGKSSTTPNGSVESIQSEQIIPTISPYNITNILNESLKTNLIPRNPKQPILNKTSVPTIIFGEPREKLISLNPKVITNVFPEATTINPNIEQIEHSVNTISYDNILNERGPFLFNIKKQQSLPNSKVVVSTTSYGENKIEIKSTAASVTDNYNAITSSMDALMNVEMDTISRVVSPESTHGISKISEKLTNVDKLPEISTQYLLGLTLPLVPSQSKTTQDKVKNILESTSEVGQISTTAMENENNLLIHNLNMKEQEILGGRNFTCNGKNIGRYADLRNPKKFYICVGMSNPVVGICPQDAIYVILQNKCYKNATICEQFHCLKGGRFADPCSRDSYFICHANSSGALVRYKLQCQKGYYVSSSIKCSPVGETTQILLKTTIGPKAQSNNETVVASICSGNNIYNASTNKCNTIDNSCAQFHCSHIGRFKDPCSSNSYYICQQNSSGALIRYKLQCQPGYEVNSKSIKCTPLPQMTITNYSKIEHIVKSENKINKSSDEKVDHVTNEKNIDNNAPNKFKEKILKEVMDRTKYKDVATYLTTNKQIEQKIKDNQRRDNVKLAKIVKVKIQKDKYNSKESSEEKFDKNIKKKQIKREIQGDSSQSVENDKFTCDTEGNYPYPQDFRKYYECTYNKKRGKFRRRRKNCKNNELFNGNEIKCVFNKN